MSDNILKRRSVGNPSAVGTPPPIKRKRGASVGNSPGIQPKQEVTGTESPSGFVELRDNVYSADVNKESILSDYQPHWCKCSTAVNGGICGADCTNRRNRVECDPTLCVAGENCSNQVIQRKSVVNQLEVVSRDGQTMLMTRNPIPEGCFIIQYTGEVMSSQSFQQRVASYGNRPTFCLPMTRDLVIDASVKGSVCRYVRHSTQASAEMLRWRVGGLHCMVLFSIRDINPGEEITFDPSKVTFDDPTQKASEVRCTVCREALGNQMVGGEDFALPHPLLGVAICGKCLLAYTERDWVPDQNGKDTFCRWCSHPGNLLACHSCPMSFCKKCLKSNLGHKTVRQAELKADKWQCIVCDASPLDKLRGVVSGSTEPPKQEQDTMGLGNLFKEERKPTLTPIRRQRGGGGGQRGRAPAGRGAAQSQGMLPTATQGSQGTPGSKPVRGAAYKGTPRPARGQMSLARGASATAPGRGMPQVRGRGVAPRGSAPSVSRGSGGRGGVQGIRPVTPVDNQLMGALAKSGISVSRQAVKQPAAANNNANMAKLQQALPRGISIVAVSESTTQSNELLKEVEDVANNLKEEVAKLRRDREREVNAKDVKHAVIRAQRKLEDLAMKIH